MEHTTGVSKSWVYTLNNPTPQEEASMKLWECSYMIFGHEVGEQGTPHLQGFVTFKRGYRLTQLKTFCPRAHWQRAVASEQAANYCTKGTDIFVKDNREQGKRNDLEDCIKNIESAGEVTRDIVMAHPSTFVKFYKGLYAFADVVRPGLPPRNPPTVYWLYGDTGTGKTRYCYDQDPDLWQSTGDLKWFDGYKGHRTALIDDFRADFCPFDRLLRLLDRYPMRVPTKGGFTVWEPQQIFITCPYSPERLYTSCPEDLQQLVRRINGGVHHVTSYETFSVPEPYNTPRDT